jgi:peptide/nickel transport system ATP-binding protein
MPDPMNLPPGCPFHPRCENAEERCSSTVPERITLEDGHFVKCLLFENKQGVE